VSKTPIDLQKGSGKNLFHHFSGDIGQAEAAALE